MSQYIAVVRGDDREEYVKDRVILTASKSEAKRFDTAAAAKEAAEALVKAVFDRKGNPRAFPWITEAAAEEVE
jgi:hypothetical protein